MPDALFIDKIELMGNKKFISYLIILVILAIVCAGVLVITIKKEKKAISEEPAEKRTVTEQQIEELDLLRQQANHQSVSSEEVTAQLEELDILRQQAETEQLEEVDKQLEELDNLRSQSRNK